MHYTSTCMKLIKLFYEFKYPVTFVEYNYYGFKTNFMKIFTKITIKIKLHSNKTEIYTQK